MSEIVVINFPQFESKIRAMADAVSGDMLMTAAKAGALLVANQAKIFAPKRTGTLAGSIHVEPIESSRNIAVVAIGTNLEYAAMVEYGYVGPQAVEAHWRTIKEAFGRQLRFPVTAAVRAHTRQINRAARPYLRPALDTTREAVVLEIRAALRDILLRFVV